MEPDFIREQVQNVWRVIAANAKLIEEKKLSIEGAFVNPDFVLNQAAALHNAVADSVKIRQLASKSSAHQFVIMKPQFLSQQGKALQVVIEDSARLQDVTATACAGLGSLSEMFVMSLVANLRDVTRDNAQVALENAIEPNALFTSRPDYTERLVTSYHCVLSAYIYQKRGLAALEASQAANERSLVDLRTQLDAAHAEKAAAIARVAEVETSVTALQLECDKLRADAKESADTAQGRIFKLEEELARMSSENLNCVSLARGNESEFLALKEEHKTLIKTCEEQRLAAAQAAEEHKTLIKSCEEQRNIAALTVQRIISINAEKQQLQSDHDALATELSDIRAASEAFSQTRAEEHDRMNIEITRLEDTLKKREAVLSSLAEEKAQLRAALDSVKADLLATNNQLSATVIQCDTWKATLDDVLSRQAAEIDEIRQAAAKEAASADGLLGNAVKKIEDLESRLQHKDTEISTLREAATRHAQRPAIPPPVKLPASPPPSSRKRAFTAEHDTKQTAVASTSASGGWVPDLAAHGSPLPPERVKELAGLPEVAVDLGPGQTVPTVFTRQSLSDVLGGSIQGLVVRCTKSATELASKHDIQDYLCPNMDHNAWSPAGPGKHGYMQVGLGRDKKLFNDGGDYRHVFVGAGKYLLYCGWYHVLRVEPLTKEEWDTLPPKVKRTYSETTVSKEKSGELRSAAQALGMYDAGVLRAPCVRLQCVAFDTAFYQELARANDRYFERKGRQVGPGPAASAGKSGHLKRRRVVLEELEAKDDESEEEVSLALATRKNAGLPTTQPSVDEKTEPATVDTSVPDLRLSTAPTDVGAASVAGPSTIPTRFSTRSQTAMSKSGTLTLRIPGGRAGDRSSQPEPDDVEVSELSSASDDDDMYADF